MSHVFVNEPKFDAVPPGEYDVELVALEDRKPFEGSKYGKGEPRLAWRYKILSGPHQGEVIEQNTGADPKFGGPKSKQTQTVTMMLGRKLAKNEKIDGDAFVGGRWRATWAVNPESEKGYCHIVAMRPLEVGNGEAPPPPPPKYLATPAASEGAEFWVLVEEGQPPVKKSRSALEEYIREGGVDPGAVLVQEVGKATGWVPASQCGFQGPIPF
jgi:hypothetical protein